MSGNGDALRGVIDEMALVLAPLVDAAQAPETFTRLLADLGWTAASVPQPLLDLAQAGSSLLDAIGSDPDEISTGHLLVAIAGMVDAIDAIRTRPDNAFPSGIDVASFKQTIGRDLLDYCVVEYLLGRRFRIGRLLKLAGIVRLIEMPPIGLRQPYLRRQVEWSRIGTLLTDPASGFREAYAWSSATPQLPNVLVDVGSVLEGYGWEFAYFRLNPEQLAFANRGALQPLAGEFGIVLDLGEALGVPPEDEAGVRLVVRPPTADRGPALAFLPFARLSASTGVASGDVVSLSLRADADLAQGVALTLAPGQDPQIEAGFLGGHAPTTPTDVQLQLTIPPAPDQPERVLIGTLDSSHVSVHTFVASVGAKLSGTMVDAFADLKLDQLRVVVKPSADDGDSFVGSLMGSGVSADLSLGIHLSSQTGFHLTGSAGLETSVPVTVQFGPVALQAISFALRPNAQGVDLEVGVTIRGSIGPVTAIADGVGFKLATRFPDPPTGNLGPIDVGLGFKPPSGIGLAVEAGGVVSGGGFLFHDPVQPVYGGVL
ncbi:MAG TPA: DUF6603 domain-containing protein, partial [Casimicrobiaceae bacterium]|nr:DUF6603 domain-containing protein [Casimicrobiaceae bacterium]